MKALLSIAAVLPLLGACAAPPPRAVPSALEPAADERLLMTVAARGVQVYECRGTAWTFVAPQAELFDAQGRSVGSHGAGPHWLAHDGSRLVGTVKARADAPVAQTIPWLLLSAQASGPQGAFSSVSHIQRINTAGGTAPAVPCDAARVGATVSSAYSADYRLFTPSR